VSLCKSKEITEDSVILTPNQRLSKIALEIDTQQKLAENKSVWAQQLVLPFQQWVIKLNQTLIQHGFLAPQLFLSPAQVEMLWRRIINQENSLLSHFSSSAVQAWELSHQWEISLQDNHFLKHDASTLWQSWALKFQALLKKNQWQDHQTALIQTLAYLESLRSLSFPQKLAPVCCKRGRESSILKDLHSFLPGNIILLGFTNFTVYEKRFLDILQNLGITITEKNFTKNPVYCAKKSFDTQEAELEALAQWAYEKSALGTVGCVIPNLSQIKNKITTIFDRYIENKNLLNISLGNSLSTYPLIQAAITGLKLLEDNLSIETISDFLLSVYYEKSFSELSKRSLLDIKLKSKLGIISSKSLLLKTLGKHYLRKFFEKNISSKIYKDFRQWRDFFDAHLHFLGWPGERILSSEEFQLISHWDNLLDNFANLSLVSTQITFSEALEKLNTLADETIFQARRSPEAKIDILGILEAAGLPFDYLWLAGLEENTWPSKGSPNPFLPLSLQKKLNMPHSSAEQDFKFAELITAQLLSSANEIMVSYPKNTNNNPTYPSILIKSITESDLALPVLPKISEKNKVVITWQEIADIQAPRLDIDINTSYGSEIFKDQAACPFRAFAKHRLKAKKIELPQLGYKAVSRGQFIHKVLEQFFKVIDNQEKLNLLSSSDLILLLDNIIQEMFNNLDSDNTNNIFTQVEKKRLSQLILSWIEQEKKRDFFTVIATEESLKTHFGQIPLNLRIDRIDKIGENKYLIIDYKTGKINFNLNSIEDEPQLPLYCVVSAINVESIGFAQLRMDEMKLKSIPAEKSTWENALLKLADDYLQGHAAVKPKYGKETCRYCDLSSLCRIKESL
jgi:ATP-dependent helicase/nuclease subunit B